MPVSTAEAASGTTVSVMTEAAADEEPASNALLAVLFSGNAPPDGAATPPVPEWNGKPPKPVPKL